MISRAKLARRIEHVRIRLRGRGPAVEAQRDLQKLLDAAVLEQALFFRAISAGLLDEAVTSFRQGTHFITAPFAEPRTVTALADRIARLLAAAVLLGRVQIRRDADLPLATVFAGELDQVGPARAVEYLRSLPVMTRDQWERAVAAQRRRAFTIAGVNQAKALESMRDLIAESLDAGLSPAQFEIRARDLLRNFETTAGKLRTIWNTNVGQALAGGRREALRDPEVAAFISWRLFDAMLDQFTRPNHELLEGAVAPADWWDANSDLQPLLGFNCLLPGNEVQGAFVGALKTSYSGPAVEIRTLHGNAVTVTGNHPVLTLRGWIPAKEVHEADHMLRYEEVAGFLVGPDENEQHAPAFIENLFESFGLEARGSFEVSPLELHQDALFTEGKVDVVAADGKLLNEFHPSAVEHVRQALLPHLNARLVDESGHGPAFDSFVGVFASPSGSPGFRQLLAYGSLQLHPFRLGPLQQLGVRLPSRFDSVALERANNGRTTDSEEGREFVHARSRPELLDERGLVGDLPALRPAQARYFGSASRLDVVAAEKFAEATAVHTAFIGKLLNRGAGRVAPEKVSRVRRFEFSGHVYDAETLTGWMVANGLVISNCRCSLIGLTATRARKLLESGGIYFNIAEQGIPAGAGPDSGFARAA